MRDEENRKYFEFRREGKIYLSKLFTYNEVDLEPKRNVHMVIEGTEKVLVGEIEGSLCLRLTGEKRKTQVTAIINQDDRAVRRLTLQSFKTRKKAENSWFESIEKDEFTFRSDEFQRLLSFLHQLKFIDLANTSGFHIEDISKHGGDKAIVDASDKTMFEQLGKLDEASRANLFRSLHTKITNEEINLLLGRRQALETFDHQLSELSWNEKSWQDFFEREKWVFGYGLDYRVMSQFDRESVVGGAGTDNRNKSITDFLMSFTDYTVIVEIKRPDTKIFNSVNKRRSGTARFSTEFIDAVSQILEQKAEWLSFSQNSSNYDKFGNKLDTRTRNSKAILIVGSLQEFSSAENDRDKEILKDTFELFRRETSSIDIITYDELYERAKYIVEDST